MDENDEKIACKNCLKFEISEILKKCDMCILDNKISIREIYLELKNKI